MKKATCPGCGAEITFRSGESVFAVCEYCRASVVRTDVKVELIGKMALLEDDWSPLQLSASGKFQNVNFVIVGRVVFRWEKGTWNEWYLAFDDGQTGWMSEAQGFYSVALPVEAPTAFPKLASLQPGTAVSLSGTTFTVDDIKKVTCSYSEGELPFRAEKGVESTSVDLRGPGKGFASLDFSGDTVRAFVGTYLDFNELHLQNLRDINGW